jgi:hypothetical protein
MSTEITEDRIIPETFLHSVFRNTTDQTLYVWWAGTNGMNIPPGERFRILGDPRVPPLIPSAHGMVESIQQMIQEGVIEFCSSPAPVVDNNRRDGRSMALFAKDGDPYLDTVPLSKEELSERTLPIITPTCSYDPETKKIRIDWSEATDLELHDRFLALVTPPKGEVFTIKCGVDKQASYQTKAGPGLYKILLRLTSVDDRTQDGVEVELNVES